MKPISTYLSTLLPFFRQKLIDLGEEVPPEVEGAMQGAEAEMAEDATSPDASLMDPTLEAPPEEMLEAPPEDPMLEEVPEAVQEEAAMEGEDPLVEEAEQAALELVQGDEPAMDDDLAALAAQVNGAGEVPVPVEPLPGETPEEQYQEEAPAEPSPEETPVEPSPEETPAEPAPEEPAPEETLSDPFPEETEDDDYEDDDYEDDDEDAVDEDGNPVPKNKKKNRIADWADSNV
jgi:hypothetical protein